MSAWDKLVAYLVSRNVRTLAVGGLVVACSALLATGVRFSSSTTDQLPRLSAEVSSWLALSERFDAFDTLVVGLEEPSEPLSSEGLSRLSRITQDLAALKAAGVLSVRSLTNVDSIREGADGSLETQLLVPFVPRDGVALAALARRVADDAQVSGALISRDQRGYLLVIQCDARKDAATLARLIHDVVESKRGPLASAYFGGPFFSAAITRGVYAQLGWLLPAFVGALLVVLLLSRAGRPAKVALVLVADAAALVVFLGLSSALGLVLTFTSLTALLLLAAAGAVVFARGLEEREAGGNPFPSWLVAALGALCIACLALTRAALAWVSSLGLALAVGMLAIGLVGLLVFVPLAGAFAVVEAPPPLPGRRFSPWLGLVAALAVLSGALWLGSRARLHATPQGMFFAREEAGRSLDFFDRRFGGPDFVQVAFQGDLRDPAVAARLLRLTDLLEGSRRFADVRSVAQVLGFLSASFGGLHRIPPTREALGNLWFFLEGRADVRSLVRDDRQEAMVVLRVPSRPGRSVNDLVAAAQAAVDLSRAQGPEAARARLSAAARGAERKLPPEVLDATLAAATAPLSEASSAALTSRVHERLRAFLASPDSPYTPGAGEWEQLAGALELPEVQRVEMLAKVIGGFPGLAGTSAPDALLETVLARERDLRLSARAELLAEQLWAGEPVPPATLARTAGIFADLLEPVAGDGAGARVFVTGLPVVAPVLERDLLGGLWWALGTLWGLFPLLWVLLGRRPRGALRSLLEAAVATALTVAVCGTLGPGVDPGSAPLYVLPSLACLLASDGLPPEGPLRPRRLTWALLLGLGLAGGVLLFVGVLPVLRIGLTLAVSLAATVAVGAASRRFRAPA